MFVLLALVISTVFVGTVLAKDVYVQGYMKKDGTYVQSHHRSAPDGQSWNNYSTSGNINPYTMEPGYKRPSGYGGSSLTSPSPYDSNNGSGVNVPGYYPPKRK